LYNASGFELGLAPTAFIEIIFKIININIQVTCLEHSFEGQVYGLGCTLTLLIGMGCLANLTTAELGGFTADKPAPDI
jgi:hypothetical protein